jgi:hypothetical protein
MRPLLAYLPWHARDSVVKAISPLVIFLAIAGIPLGVFTASTGVPLFGGDERVAAMALSIWPQATGLAITIGAILVMSQVISLDREKQHVRFLFAHPVSPVAFYVQRFVVGVVMLVLAFAPVPLLFSRIVEVPILATFYALLLQSLLIGGLCTLASVLTQRDGAWVIGVYLVSNVVQGISGGGGAPKWLETLAWALPPVQQANGFASAWLNGRTVAPEELVLVVGYSLGMIATAFFLLRRAPHVR